MEKPDSQTTPPHLQCDAPGCTLEIIMIDHGEKYCYWHALEKGNQERVARGFPPVTIDDEGMQHVVQ